MTADDFYDEFFIYTFNVALKTVMNIGGWVIGALFYGDFCDHCDYMEEYIYATPEDLLHAEYIKCEWPAYDYKSVEPEYCARVAKDFEEQKERQEQAEKDAAEVEEEVEEEFEP